MTDMGCRHKTVMAFGIIQVLIAVGVLGAGIAVITEGSIVKNWGHGIWGGLFILLTGIFGIVGGAKPMRGLEIAFMVLSIISAAVLSGLLMRVSAWGAWADVVTSCLTGYLNGGCKDESDGAISANLAILAFSALLLLFALLSAIFACCAVCQCCGATREDAVIPMRHHPPPQQPQYGHAQNQGYGAPAPQGYGYA